MSSKIFKVQARTVKKNQIPGAVTPHPGYSNSVRGRGGGITPHAENFVSIPSLSNVSSKKFYSLSKSTSK